MGLPLVDTQGEGIVRVVGFSLMPVAGLAAVAPLARGGQDRKPTISSIRDSAVPAERTIAERIAKVDAVAVIRVLGSERTRAIDIAPFVRADNPGMDIPAMVDVYTEQDVIVTEALRSHSSVITGGTVILSRAGGRVSTATGDFFTKATSVELVPGGRYLVLLKFNALLGVWEANPFDVFGLDGARVGLTANSSLTGYGQQLGKLTPAQAIEAIRRTSPRN